jgi:hypothetical protein
MLSIFKRHHVKPERFTLPPPHNPSAGLPDWFLRLSPASWDALKGPDDQYCDGARDMLAVIRSDQSDNQRSAGGAAVAVLDERTNYSQRHLNHQQGRVHWSPRLAARG